KMRADGEHGAWFLDPVLSPDHQLLARQRDEISSTVLVTDRSPRRRGERILNETAGADEYLSLTAVAFSPDGALLAGVSSTGPGGRSRIHFWDVAGAMNQPVQEDS